MNEIAEISATTLRQENLKLKQALLGMKRRLQGGQSADIEEELSLLRTRLGVAEERAEKQRTRIAGLVERLQERDKKMQILEEEIETLDSKLQHREQTSSNLENDLRKAREALDAEIIRAKELAGHDAEATQVIDELRKRLADAVEKAHEAEASNESLKRQLATLHDTSDKERRSAITEVEKVRRGLDQYMKESKAVEERYLAAVKEKVAAAERADRLQSELEEMGKRIEKQEQRLEEQRRRLSLLEPLERELAATKIKVKEILGEKCALEEQLTRLMADAEHKQELQSQLEELGQQHRALSDSLEAANAAYKEAMAQISGLRDACRDKTRTSQELEAKVRAAEEMQGKLQEQLSTASGKVKEREAQLESSQRHLARSLKEVTMLRAALEKRKLELLQAQGTFSDCKAELKELQLRQELAEEKVRAAESHAQRTESEARGWQSKQHAAEKELSEAKAKIAQLERGVEATRQIEKEYQRLKGIFSNIRSSIGTLGVAEAPSLEADEMPSEDLFHTSGEQPLPPRADARGDLFDAP